ncbi:MAG: hypothetical protein WD066_19635 [Planctomycetaceae bacterium]
MTDLNQYELSKTLGSRITPVQEVRFGATGLLRTVAEGLKAHERLQQSDEKDVDFGYEDDRTIVQAFEDIRGTPPDNAPPDALLWDPKLAAEFVRRCRELGFDAPEAAIKRRVLNVRKNKSRYAKKGIFLSPTTKKETLPSISPMYIPSVEFALVSLRYRTGASIDEILLEPRLANGLEELVHRSVPTLSGEQIRLAALNIRKSRFIRKADRKEVGSLDITGLEAKLSAPIVVNELDIDTLPDDPGLIELDEATRHLYVCRSESIRAAATQLANGVAFSIVDGRFWHPDLERIALRYVVGRDVGGFSMQKWEHRLLQVFKPVFNWPIQRTAA